MPSISLLDFIESSLKDEKQHVFKFTHDNKSVELTSSQLLGMFAAGFPAALPKERIGEIGEHLFSALNTVDSNSPPYGIAWFLSIFNSLHDGVLIADNNVTVRYINKSFERISGARFEELVGRYLPDVRPGSRLGGVIKSGTPLLGIRRKWGEIEYITDMYPLKFGDVVWGGVTIARDITQIRKLQTSLDKYQARYAKLLQKLPKETLAVFAFSDIIGNSAAINNAKQLAQKLAVSELPILIRGESGTGKELFAHSVHKASLRRAQPFIAINCAAIPDSLLESELFGYKGGAFSGAKSEGKTGLIAMAHEGTLFLDEIGDMNLELQAKMLRVLQTGQMQPVGSTAIEQVDIRLVTATNKPLESMIEQGKFREDLFYRLNVSQVHIPPLRERPTDIPLLLEFFLQKYSLERLQPLTLTPETREFLEGFSWPGNVRELENTIRFLASIADEGMITPEYLPPIFLQQNGTKLPIKNSSVITQENSSLKKVKALNEREYILSILAQFEKTVSGKRLAAKQLGISLSTLYARIRDLGLE